MRQVKAQKKLFGCYCFQKQCKYQEDLVLFGQVLSILIFVALSCLDLFTLIPKAMRSTADWEQRHCGGTQRFLASEK